MKHQIKNFFTTQQLLLHSAVFFLILLPACAPTPSSIKATRRYEIMREKTKKQLGIDVDWNMLESSNCCDVMPEVEEMLSRGITRDEAVAIALMHNYDLHADFESLGISRADLVQAGLYSNPSTDTIFAFPNDPEKQVVVTFGISISIDDLWRIPLREKVAKAELEITTARILQTIINTIADTKIAYDNHLYQQANFETQKLIVQNSHEFRKKIFDKKIYPKPTSLDQSVSDALVFQSELTLTDIDTAVNLAYINLRNQLGLKPEPKPLKLTSSFTLDSYDLPDQDLLNKVAFNNAPDIQIARLTVQQATDALALERASFIQNFSGGIQYLRDSDGTKFIGPEINIDIPIFDNNSAQVAKAKYTLEQARRQYRATVNNVINNVQQAYQNSTGYDEIIDLAEKVMQANEQAIMFADEHMNLAMLNSINATEIRLNMYESQRNVLKIKFDALQFRHELERAIGKSLSLIPVKKEKEDDED